MLRSTATRALVKSFTKVPASRSSHSAASFKLNALPLRHLNQKRPQVLRSLIPTTTQLFYATNPKGPPYDIIDEKSEKKVADTKIAARPDDVSLASSVRHIVEEGQGPKEDDDVVLRGMKGDLKTIKETFALNTVPKESYYIGAAGVVPYAATSLSTVFLAYDINLNNTTGHSLIFSPETAHQLLDFITPIQIGYGAVIISFLGAIHWGLEYAGYGGHHSYRRYMIGVIAPAVAWPTIFMPVEYALITQFLAFNFLYFADARATVRGWFPPWYSTYRFVLTFFVGASIVVSLIGRGQIVHDPNLKNPLDQVKRERDQQWAILQREEVEKQQAIAGAEEAEQDDGEGKDDGDEEEDSKDDKQSEKDKKK
ncbi:hypothetical protein B7494_g6293 [Chlorociboria aeruginascens]|nr:hypothetical protein B7494_g6293 [Chlorociboria aeruginascens]